MKSQDLKTKITALLKLLYVSICILIYFLLAENGINWYTLG